MMEKVYLSLGSNLGDRKANLDKAVELLSAELGTSPLAVSDYIETESWGFDAPQFMNAALAFELDDPDGYELLGICKNIESGMGREENVVYDEEGKRIYHSRIIDIDILLIGDRKIDSKTLTVPHPLMEQREFVMVPLRQIRNEIENINN